MKASIVIATCGDPAWAELAHGCAYCSAQKQPAHDIVLHHGGDNIAEARNQAAEQATGDWLLFLDADDELGDGYLEAMAKAKRSGALLYPAVEWVNWNAVRPRGNAKLPAEADLRDTNWMVIGTMLTRRMFNKVGGFRDYLVYEDWDLWQRCWLAGAKPIGVPDAHYIAWTRNDSRNRTWPMHIRDEVHHKIRSANMPELYA